MIDQFQPIRVEMKILMNRKGRSIVYPVIQRTERVRESVGPRLWTLSH